MIVTLEETKQYLRVDADHEDTLVKSLIAAAEGYLYNATGTTFNQQQPLAKLLVLILVADWFENRETVGHVTRRTRDAVQSIMTQLKYCYRGEGYTFDTYSREWVQVIPEGDRT